MCWWRKFGVRLTRRDKFDPPRVFTFQRAWTTPRVHYTITPHCACTVNWFEDGVLPYNHLHPLIAGCEFQHIYKSRRHYHFTKFCTLMIRLYVHPLQLILARQR